MDYIAHVGLVDTHAESDRRDDHIDLLIQESILIRRTGNGIHAGMVRRHLDAVGGQQFGQLLDLFAAQAVDDSGFARIALDIADDLFGRIEMCIRDRPSTITSPFRITLMWLPFAITS